MSRYSEERKEGVLRKMLPPNNRPLGELAAEEGISEATLYNWRRHARLATIGQSAAVLAHGVHNPLASNKRALSGPRGVDTLPERERGGLALVLGEVDRLDALRSETLDHVRPIEYSTRRGDRACAPAHPAGVARSLPTLRLRPGCGNGG